VGSQENENEAGRSQQQSQRHTDPAHHSGDSRCMDLIFSLSLEVILIEKKI